MHFVNVACNNKGDFRLATTGWCNSININGIKDCSCSEGEPPVAADRGDNSIISLKGGRVSLYPSGVCDFDAFLSVLIVVSVEFNNSVAFQKP